MTSSEDSHNHRHFTKYIILQNTFANFGLYSDFKEQYRIYNYRI